MPGVTYRHWYFRRCAYAIAVLVVLLVLMGGAKISGAESENRVGNQSNQTELPVTTQAVYARLASTTRMARYRSATVPHRTAEYERAFDAGENTSLTSSVDTEQLPVEKFYALLRLCVISQNCVND